ncbi:MAG: glycosyltransferase family 4 protein [Anaerolineae bacterium]|nr:glycosyltransferase family 4 protein [Anaerolineae bacterium]
MRILMVVRQFYPWVGGTERQAQKLAAKLIAAGVDVKVVTGWWFRDTPRQETIDTIPVLRNFTCWGLFGIKGLRKFGGYIYILSLFWQLWRQRRQYDIIHIHLLSYPAFPAVLMGKLLGKKSLIKIANSGHDSDIRRMQENDMIPGQKQMLPTTLKADKMVAVNKQIISELQAVGIPLKRITYIPNGVETDQVTVVNDYKVDDVATLLFVGRLHPQKGVDTLLKALARVRQQHPATKWQLWLLGDGALRAELEALTAQLDIASCVQFWGKVPDVAHYLGQADLFVLPSRAEGMSNALLEAMAHGLPCIATDIDGNVDVVQHNHNGLLVPPSDEEALAEQIIRLLNNQPLREKLGRAARSTIEAEFSIDAITQKYIDLYDRLLEPHRQTELELYGSH